MSTKEEDLDSEKLAKVLEDLYAKNLISKISITGGEPLYDLSRTNNILDTIFTVNPKAKVDITTNGSMLFRLDQLSHVNELATIHISRHHYDDLINCMVFDYVTSSSVAQLENLAKMYPGKISLNCCLVPGYIDSPERVERYLDWAAKIKGLKSAGFISLMDKNEFCRTEGVKEKEILEWIDNNPDNFNHDYLYDTDICECRVWKRVTKSYLPITAFWWKVNRLDLPYCRQLIFTEDNRLTVNFNEIAEIYF